MITTTTKLVVFFTSFSLFASSIICFKNPMKQKKTHLKAVSDKMFSFLTECLYLPVRNSEFEWGVGSFKNSCQTAFLPASAASVFGHLSNFNQPKLLYQNQNINDSSKRKIIYLLKSFYFLTYPLSIFHISKALSQKRKMFHYNIIM